MRVNGLSYFRGMLSTMRETSEGQKTSVWRAAEVTGDHVEGQIQLSGDLRQCDDDSDRNQGRDQPILDGGDAGV